MAACRGAPPDGPSSAAGTGLAADGLGCSGSGLQGSAHGDHPCPADALESLAAHVVVVLTLPLRQRPVPRPPRGFRPHVDQPSLPRRKTGAVFPAWPAEGLRMKAHPSTHRRALRPGPVSRPVAARPAGTSFELATRRPANLPGVPAAKRPERHGVTPWVGLRASRRRRRWRFPTEPRGGAAASSAARCRFLLPRRVPGDRRRNRLRATGTYRLSRRSRGSAAGRPTLCDRWRIRRQQDPPRPAVRRSSPR